MYIPYIVEDPGDSMSQVVGLPNNSYKTITNTACVRARLCKLQIRCTRLVAASDKVYQLLVHGGWFSPGTPASSTTKNGRNDIAEILLKVALSTINQVKSYPYIVQSMYRSQLSLELLLIMQVVVCSLLFTTHIKRVVWDIATTLLHYDRQA